MKRLYILWIKTVHFLSFYAVSKSLSIISKSKKQFAK